MRQAFGNAVISMSRRRLSVGLIGFALLLSCAPLVAYAQALTGTYLGSGVGRRVAFVRNERVRNAWAGTLRFKLDSGEEVLVYCIQLDVAIAADAKYVDSGPVEDLPNGCQIRHILDNYAASEVTEPAEGAARQLAVWHFSDDVDLESITEETLDIRDRSLEIAELAAAAACPPRRTEPPDLQIEPSSVTRRPGERLVYTITADEFDAGQPITATLTGPAVFDDGTKLAIAVLDASGAATLGVTGTGDGESAISVALPYVLEAGVVFAELDPSRPSQRLVMAQRLDSVAEAEARTVWFDDSTETPTSVPWTATPVPTDVTPPTATQTEVPAVTPTVTPTVNVTASATASQPTPEEEDTPSPRPTPAMPERLPDTGAGGAAGPPIGLFALLLVAAGCLMLRRTPRAPQ